MDNPLGKPITKFEVLVCFVVVVLLVFALVCTLGVCHSNQLKAEFDLENQAHKDQLAFQRILDNAVIIHRGRCEYLACQSPYSTSNVIIIHNGECPNPIHER